MIFLKKKKKKRLLSLQGVDQRRLKMQYTDFSLKNNKVVQEKCLRVQKYSLRFGSKWGWGTLQILEWTNHAMAQFAQVYSRWSMHLYKRGLCCQHNFCPWLLILTSPCVISYICFLCMLSPYVIFVCYFCMLFPYVISICYVCMFFNIFHMFWYVLVLHNSGTSKGWFKTCQMYPLQLNLQNFAK